MLVIEPYIHGYVRKAEKIGKIMTRRHGRNFVVKCGGTTGCETNIVIGSMEK